MSQIQQHVQNDSWTGPASAEGNARFKADSFENSCSQKLLSASSWNGNLSNRLTTQ